MITRQPLSLAQVNSLGLAALVAALGHLFEGTPAIVERAWATRPFGSLEALHRALVAVLRAMPPDEQVALIRAHPDLAGRAAIAGELTHESASEQAAARLDQLSPAEFVRFHELNSAYSTRFGFPFVICVREHTRASILANFERRLYHTREEEIETALAEIAKIARLRLYDAVYEDAGR
jgi:2-oxo-4-hydroxy-4-carboxy-5-ureidoimidazoline decarboxylase